MCKISTRTVTTSTSFKVIFFFFFLQSLKSQVIFSLKCIIPEISVGGMMPTQGPLSPVWELDEGVGAGRRLPQEERFVTRDDFQDLSQEVDEYYFYTCVSWSRGQGVRSSFIEWIQREKKVPLHSVIKPIYIITTVVSWILNGFLTMCGLLPNLGINDQ